jgi:hypothetical protein
MAIALENVKDQSDYCWHRIVYLIQNPIKMESAQNFFVAVCGISKLIDEFLNFGRRGSEKNGILESPVNGNTILNMFGEWIFASAAHNKAGYELGRAEALKCLCKVFSHLQRIDSFHAHYLQEFYCVLSKGLSGDFLSLCAIIKNSNHIFALGLEGLRLLTPDFIKGITRILPVVQATTPDFLNQKIDLDSLRQHAYQILGCIIFNLNLLKDTPVHFPVTDIVLSKSCDANLKNLVEHLYFGSNPNCFSSVIALRLNE